MVHLNKQFPIGIFDSGVGGLTVAKAVKSLLPCESIIYIADTASSPFGLKTELELKEILLKNLDLFRSLPIKMLLIACHTACSAGLDLFKPLDIPVLGITSGVNDLLISNQIGFALTILATDRTISSGLYQNMLSSRKELETFFLPCSPIERLIESLCEDHQKISETLRFLFSSIQTKEDNTVVLGCTHFPFFHNHIKKILPDSTRIWDPATYFATRVFDKLKALDLLSPSLHSENHFIVTQDIEAFKKKFNYYLKDFFSPSRSFFNQTCGMI